MSFRERQYQNAHAGCQPGVGNLVDRLFAAVSPWQCVLCGEPAAGMDICPNCLDDLPWLGHACRSCAMPLRNTAENTCGRCAQEGSSLPACGFGGCRAALAYEFPVDRLLTGLKFSARMQYARVLGELLAIRIHEYRREEMFFMPDMLVPVPLHPRRLAARGFNQAAEIARWVAAEHGIAMAPEQVKRLRHTSRQTGLSRNARQKNVVGAFAVSPEVMNQRVAVVDDVITTQATAREIARAVRRAGAAVVQVWAVARTCS
jgi:ComF family protein